MLALVLTFNLKQGVSNRSPKANKRVRKKPQWVHKNGMEMFYTVMEKIFIVISLLHVRLRVKIFFFNYFKTKSRNRLNVKDDVCVVRSKMKQQFDAFIDDKEEHR